MAGTIHEIRKYRLHRRRAQLKFTKKSANRTGSSKLEVPAYVIVSHTGNLLAFLRIYGVREAVDCVQTGWRTKNKCAAVAMGFL